MVLWILFMAMAFLASAAGLWFLIGGAHRFRTVALLSRGNAKARWVLSAAVVLLPLAGFWMAWGAVNALLIALHLAVFGLVAYAVRRLIRKLRGKDFRFSWTGGVAVVLTAVYLTVGYAQAYGVRRTSYTILTDKEVGHLRVALLADSHVGTTFDGAGLARHLASIQVQEPDVLVISGDFVDESTSREDMIAACRALGEVTFPYGIYYVFGNHDKGNYGTRRGYTGEDLARELTANGVTVLQDEVAWIGENDGFALIGRQDASEERDFGGSRASMETLTRDLDRSRFSIVLDHQPRDYEAQAAAGVDLVLSGHTHGGQMIPMARLMRYFGGNDSVYGYEKRDGTQFVVTSGISDWAIKFKTGCFSEYVILDIRGK